MPDYPYYDVISKSEENIQQGDIVQNCPILIPKQNAGTIKRGDKLQATVRKFNVVVMSQSCDLAHEKIELVLVCPFYELDKIMNDNPYLRSSNGRKELKNGNLPSYHLLHPCDKGDFNKDKFLVVDFRNVYGIDVVYLREFVKKLEVRMRILPPYREHLSQAFARFFMRVGLPLDLPKIAPYDN